jgi:type IV secretory pathway VirB2 component (pilin)
VKLLWVIIAVVCIVVAGFMALRGKLEAAFVIAALGVVSWFLNYRGQMKDAIAASESDEANNGEDSDEN